MVSVIDKFRMNGLRRLGYVLRAVEAEAENVVKNISMWNKSEGEEDQKRGDLRLYGNI